MSFEEAAAFPVVYLTAHHMMLFTGTCARGSRVLIHSAAGGVGLAAIRIAKMRECEIFGIASRSKHAFSASRAASTPSTTTPTTRGDPRAHWRTRRRSRPRSGGRQELDGRLRAARAGGPPGRVRALGGRLGQEAEPAPRRQVIQVKKWSPMKLMDDNKAVQGVNMGHLFGELEMLAEQFEALVAMYEARRDPAARRSQVQVLRGRGSASLHPRSQGEGERSSSFRTKCGRKATGGPPCAPEGCPLRDLRGLANR